MPTGKLTQTQNLTGGINTGNHKTLMNRDAADQHPMSSITGLLDALNSDTSKISAVEEKIDSEANRAIQNEQQLAAAIEETAKEAKILVETEKARAENIENYIIADIANVRAEIEAGDAAVTKLVEQETTRAEAREAELEELAKETKEVVDHIDDIIFPLKKAIADETENRIKRDNEIISDFTADNYRTNIRIDQEIIDRTEADEQLRETVKKDIEPRLVTIESDIVTVKQEIKDLEETIGEDIKEKVEGLQQELATETLNREAADAVLDKKIDGLAEYVDEHVKDIRIEDITKTTKLETRAESGYYLADKFIANTNYYEKIELDHSRISQENIDLQSEYIPVKINEKNFIKNKYYVYRASTSKNQAPVYRIARFFDPNKKYYQYSYGTDDTISFGMWLMPEKFNFAIQNLPRVINNEQSAMWTRYNSSINAVTLKYYWYDSKGILQRPPVGRICVNSNYNIGSIEPDRKYRFSHVVYGNWSGIIGSGPVVYWWNSSWADESYRLIYVEDTTGDGWYADPVNTALGLKYDFRAEKVSDILLPYGDNSHHKEWRRVYPTAADFKNENNVYYENIYECMSELVEVSESEIPVGAARYKAITGVSQDVLTGTWRFPKRLSKPIPDNLSWSGNYVCRFRDGAGGGVFGNGLRIFAGRKHTDGSQWFSMNFNSEFWREGNTWLMAENKIDAETGELYGQCCQYLSFEAEDAAMYNIVTNIFEGERISDKILGIDFFEWEELEQQLANKYPVYEQVLPTDTKTINSTDEKYFITKVPEDALNEYVVTRMSVKEDVSIIRGSTGADVFVVTDDNAYVNGTALHPVINTDDSQKPEIMLVNNGELVYTAPLISLLVDIPANTSAGFCSSIMFEVQDKISFNFDYINNTKLPVRFIKFGQVVEKQYLDFASGNQYTMLVMCNGRIIEIYIQEILL